MKLYKYRDFSNPDNETIPRLADILEHQAFWSADPKTLNDPEEFFWSCDYTPTGATLSLLTQVLMKTRGHAFTEARTLAEHAVLRNRLQPLAEPVFNVLVSRCRDELGLVCFGSTATNECLWQRYGGEGTGVCIELDVPSSLLNTQVHPVAYVPSKSLHIDRVLEASLEPQSVRHVYSVVLLSKPAHWAPEAELRFVSQRQGVRVRLNGSYVSAIVMGRSLPETTRRRIQELINRLSYALPFQPQEA